MVDDVVVDDSEEEDRNILNRFADSAPIKLVRRVIVRGVDLIPGEPDEVDDKDLKAAKTRFEEFAGE